MLTLVLLPGMDGTGDLFQPLVEKLSNSVTARILSYPPTISSSIESLEAQVHEVLPTEDDYVLLGESFSSPIAIRIAAQQPERLRGLILCCGFARSPLQGWRRQALSALAPMFVRLPLTCSRIRQWLLTEDASQAGCDQVRAALQQVHPAVLASRLRQIFNTDVLDQLPKINVPTLYLQATKDKLVGAECLEEILQANDAVQGLPLDAPHLLLQAQPLAAARTIQAFMRLCER